MRNLLLFLLTVALLCATVPACLPPATCTPGAMRCDDDTPMTCSSTGREWAVSAPRVRCAEVGGVCAVHDNLAACVPAAQQVSDAGVNAPADGGE